VVKGDVKLMFLLLLLFFTCLLSASYDHSWLLISTTPTISCGVALFVDAFNGPYQTAG
jgi:hypothetical protein